MERVLIAAFVAGSLLLSACGGPGEVEVPKVTGSTEGEAREILLDAGLEGDFTYAQGLRGPVEFYTESPRQLPSEESPRQLPSEESPRQLPSVTCAARVAIEQVPPPGESLEEGSRVRVAFDCP